VPLGVSHPLAATVHLIPQLLLDRQQRIRARLLEHEVYAAGAGVPDRGWAQGINASLGRVLVTVSSSRAFVEGVS
jgi:hypothetical protein